MQIYKCIKNVTFNERTLFLKGTIFEKDDKNNISPPIAIDFDNDEYFVEYTPKFKNGMSIIFTDKLGRKKYGHIVKYCVRGDLYSIMLENEKVPKGVKEKNLTLAKQYYFINTQGDIHRTYEGKDSKRDKYTKATNNQFETQQEAERALNILLNPGNKTYKKKLL